MSRSTFHRRHSFSTPVGLTRTLASLGVRDGICLRPRVVVMARALLLILLLPLLTDWAVAKNTTWPAISAPELNGKNTVCRFPSQVTDVIVGGHGRFLIARLPRLYCLAIVDLNTLKIVRYVRLQQPDQAVAAGAEHLLVFDRKTRQAQRWSLKTLEKAGKADALPGEGTILAAAMGCSSNGPLLVISEPSEGVKANGGRPEWAVFHDSKTLQPLKTTTEFAHKKFTADWSAPLQVCASDNGTTFGIIGPNVLLQIVGNRVIIQQQSMAKGSRPGTFGRTFYHKSKRLILADAPSSRQVNRNSNVRQIPAIDWPGSLVVTSVRQQTRGVVLLDGVALPMAHVVLDKRPIVTDTRGPSFVERDLWMIPSEKLVALLSHDHKSLQFVHIDVERAMREASKPFLTIVRKPADAAAPGQTIDYKPLIFSNADSMTIKLEYGPVGMQIDDTGSLQWTVPDNVTTGVVEAGISVKAGAVSSSQTISFPVVAELKNQTTDPSKASASHLTLYSNGKPPTANARTDASDPLTRDVRAISLPEPATTEVSVGGGGRFLVLQMRKLKKLAIIDFSRAELVGLIPGQGKFTAGSRALFVFNDAEQTLERWDLESLQFEKSVSLKTLLAPTTSVLPHALRIISPVITSVRMGAAADDVLMLSFRDAGHRHIVAMIDAKTLQPMPLTILSNVNQISAMLESGGVASADGRSYRGSIGGRGAQASVMIRHESTIEIVNAAHLTIKRDANERHRHRQWNHRYPVLQSPQGGPALQLVPPHQMGNGDQWTANLVDRNDKRLDSAATVQLGSDRSSAWHLQFLSGTAGWFRPEYKLAAMLMDRRQTLNLFRVDATQLLNEADIAPLVMSRPPIWAHAGSRYEYVLQLFPSEQKVTFKIQSGPDGMQIDDRGHLTWDVPSIPESHVVYPVIRVTDSRNRKTDHQLTLLVPNYSKILVAKRKADERRRIDAIAMQKKRPELVRLNRQRNGAKLREAMERFARKNREARQPLRLEAIAKDDRRSSEVQQLFSEQSAFGQD